VRRANLPESCLADPEALIPSWGAWRFRDLTARTSGQPNVATEATRGLGLRDLGAFGAAVCRQPTLYRSLNEFRRLVHTQTSTLQVRLHALQQGLFFCDQFLIGRNPTEWHTDLYVLGWMLKAARLAKPGWTPAEVWVRSKPTHGREQGLRDLGFARYHFNCQSTGFIVPASMLALPLASDHWLSQYDDHDDGLLRSAAPATTLAGSLLQVLNSYAGDRWLTVGEAAEIAGTSVRTMQRRLDSEGQSFTNLVEETRLTLAMSMLEDTDAPVSEIGYQLGYTSAANFTRAFRRWFAVSPSAFRMQRRGAGRTTSGNRKV